MAATIKEAIMATCKAQRVPPDFIAYFLTMIELAGGDVNIACEDHSRFMATIERNLTEMGYEGSMCMKSTFQNDPRTG